MNLNHLNPLERLLYTAMKALLADVGGSLPWEHLKACSAALASAEAPPDEYYPEKGDRYQFWPARNEWTETIVASGMREDYVRDAKELGRKFRKPPGKEGGV